MKGLVHRKNIIVSVNEAYENAVLETIEGHVPVFKGDKICSNMDGDQLVFSSDYIQKFEEVEIKPVEKKKMESSFAAMYAEQIEQMNELEQEEDESYIKGKQNGWAFENALNETYNG